METNDTTNQVEQSTPETGELSHSDKMIGVFSEPAKMFAHTSKFPPRNKDWVIPMLTFFIVVALIRILAMTNEEIFFEAKQDQIDRIESMVESGAMNREQADSAIEGINQQMEFMQGPVGWIISIVSTLIFGFIIFFLIVGIYFLFIKFLLKGEGTFGSALVANGLTAYISILQIILAGIITMAMGKMVMDTSAAAFMDVERTTLTGWILAKIDPISIWAYIVLAIGFAKMFRSQSNTKYYALVFGLWLIGGFILFQIASAVPFLGFLMQ